MSASILMHSGRPITGFGFALIILAIAAVIFVSICWQLLDNLIKRTRGRNWPIASANIDIVSVADVTDNARFPSYLATLSYVYRSPEQQMGEYNRRFGNKDDAEAWANSYKGETVRVHVNPRDPSRSVLREEDL